MTGALFETVRKPSPLVPGARATTVDRKCSCEGGGHTCAKCAAENQQKQRPDERQPAVRRAASTPHLHYDFGRVRLHSGLDDPHGHDARCHSGKACEDDPLVDYQGSGETSCDTSTGNMTTTLTEHCAGDCVAQHEAIHRRDRAPCCTRVKKCLDRAGGDAAKQAACNDAFNTWFPQLSDWTECNAYTREVSCLTSFIKRNCGNPRRGGVTEECCGTLREELEFAEGERTTRCASAVKAPCPFKANGTIA